MSLPRAVVPGRTYMITRHCSERRFFRIVGRAAVRAQHWSDSPRSREPRRVLDPRVACKNTWRRIEALARNKVWLEAYRRARKAFVAGVATLFPIGTFWLRRNAGVTCEPAQAG